MKKKPEEPNLIDAEDPILDFLDQASRRFASLPFSDPLPGEMKQLGAYLRGRPVALVYSMAQVILDQPELFSGGERRGLELYHRQGRALSWLQACHVLERWHERARENYIKEQGLLVKEVIGLVDRIDTEDRLWQEDLPAGCWQDQDWVQREWLPRLLRQQALWTVRLYLLMRKALCRPRAAGQKPKPPKPPGPQSGALAREAAAARIKRLFQRELRRLTGR